MTISFGNFTDGTTNGLVQILTLSYASGSIVFVDILGNTGPIISVVSLNSGSFTKHSSSGASQTTDRWYLVPSGAQTNDTITVTQSGGAFIYAAAYSINGADTSSPFDSGGPISNGPDPQSITTATNNTLVIAFFRESSTPTPTAGSGWTAPSSLTSGYGLFEYQLLPTAGTLSATQTIGNGNASWVLIDAIKQASGGGPTLMYTQLFMLGVG